MVPSLISERDPLFFPLCLIIFLLNSLIFITFYDPVIQGYGDAIRGWKQFNDLRSDNLLFWGQHNQMELRVNMVLVTLLELLSLLWLGLIERKIALAYLCLPMAAYLSTKLKLEFLFFPLALISLNLGWKKEVLSWLFILFLTIFLKENNGFIILCFRLLSHIFQILKPSLISVALFASVIFFVDENIQILFGVIPDLQSYNYTREIVNPEYGVIETVIVFFSSMILSINPNVDYIIGFSSTFLVLLVSFGFIAFSNDGWCKWIREPKIQAGFLTIFLFTSLTHAFQNSRYYFFYVHLFDGASGSKARLALFFTSVPVTFFMTVYYKSFLEM